MTSVTSAGGSRRELVVPLGDFGIEALREAAGRETSLPAVARQSLYYYLSERESGRPSWPYPSFARDAGVPDVAGVAISVDVGRAAWDEFAGLAAEQGVGPELLLRHAMLLFSADVEAGRVARRLLEGLV